VIAELHAAAALYPGKYTELSGWEAGWNLEEKNISTVSTVDNVGQKAKWNIARAK
jgi:hypothetical protein